MARKPKLTDEFGIAESLGEITTLDEEITPAKAAIEEKGVIDNPEEFRIAIGQAEMSGEKYVEVSEKLFKYLVKNSKTRYITYGDGGIKVYKVGTKTECDYIESLTAEQYIDYMAKQGTTNA